MSNHPFRVFIDLIALDGNILVLQQDIATHVRRIDVLKNEQKKYDNELEKARLSVMEAQKMVHETERDMKVLDEQEQIKKKQLEAIAHYKEYQSMKHELEYIHEEQQKQEGRVIEAWNRLETLQKLYETTKKEYTIHKDRMEHDITVLQSELQQRENQYQELLMQRPGKEQYVPKEWLEKYGSMRSKVADPVVPIMEGLCGACYQILPEQERIRASRGSLLQCKGCYRLLYNEEACKRLEQ
ncbi:MAG TPA: hypothetical protein VEK38_02800 [Candidatus Bathyarchaeia archaeon]|nr:hypothetical protein [Candidatus Bathyarchaeia archaeon]